MKIPVLATNVIGSFPLSYSPRNFQRTLDDQVDAGLDFVSYPQLSDMNLMFLESQEDETSFRREGERFTVGQGFSPTVNKDVRRWAEDAREVLRMKKGFVRLKSCVTGPFTLASSLEVEGMTPKSFPGAYVEMLVEHPWVLEKLTSYVRKICLSYSSVSSMVSVDEPYLSVLVGMRKNLFELAMSRGQSRELIIESLDRALGGVRTASAIHVCGAISRPLAEILLEAEADVLSHEFSGTPANIQSYDQRDLESYEKTISAGVVTTTPVSDNDGVESPPTIQRRMQDAIDRFGVENVIFSPDCGFRPLGKLLREEKGHELAMTKVRAMVDCRRDLAIGLGILTSEKSPER